MERALAIICIIICFIEIIWCITQGEIVGLILFIIGAAIWIYNLAQMK